MSAFPDITVRERKKDDKFVIIACDGIWDCLSNEEACESVNKKHDEIKPDKKNIHKIVEKIFDEILAPNTEDGIGTDNMTCILSYFNSS